ncbi:MAG: amidohydrolase family protein, partial [Bacteroidales bacterium]|nr:amidohydrolase family protein [Bacteroidales bacterium]
MKNTLFFISFFFLSLLFACSPKEKADLVIMNAKVVTIDDDNPRAEAIAIIDDRIVAVGTNARIEKYVDDAKTELIDAEGRLVIPGFNDAHAHFGPVNPDYVELRYITDPALITEKVREQVARSKPGELIRGGHWEHEMFITR